MKISHSEFEKLAKEAFSSIPHEFKDRLDNIDIVIVDRPSFDCNSRRHGSSRGLLGLYRGVPLRRRGAFYSNVLSDRIILYKDNIERLCKTKEELKEAIKDVLFHEIGHYFGLNEHDLRNIEKG
jgi:predicted Zn-dependent protease with MMP-like domain